MSQNIAFLRSFLEKYDLSRKMSSAMVMKTNLYLTETKDIFFQ